MNSESPAHCLRWIRGNLIGAGSFGQVNLAINIDNGQLFAVKSVNCSDVSKGGLSAIENEVEILQSLHSSNIVRCFGSDYSFEHGVRMRNLFMEYVAGGSLADIVSKFGGQIEEPLIRVFTRSILEGLSYLHGKGIVHCDIKGKNILVGSTGIKIADFGIAKRIGTDSPIGEITGPIQAIRGTLLWMAPEVVQQVEQGPASDIWSLGCTILEMATGRPPWSNSANAFAALYRIGCTDEIPTLPHSLSSQARDFLHKCFQRDPKARWTSAQLLQHPFLAEHIRKSNCPTSLDMRPLSPTSILDFPCGGDLGDSQSTSVNSVPVLSLRKRLSENSINSLSSKLYEETTGILQDAEEENSVISRKLINEINLTSHSLVKSSHVETHFRLAGSASGGKWITVRSRQGGSQSRQKPLSAFMVQPSHSVVTINADAPASTVKGCEEVNLECLSFLRKRRSQETEGSSPDINKSWNEKIASWEEERVKYTNPEEEKRRSVETGTGSDSSRISDCLHHSGREWGEAKRRKKKHTIFVGAWFGDGSSTCMVVGSCKLICCCHFRNGEEFFTSSLCLDYGFSMPNSNNKAWKTIINGGVAFCKRCLVAQNLQLVHRNSLLLILCNLNKHSFVWMTRFVEI